MKRLLMGSFSIILLVPMLSFSVDRTIKNATALGADELAIYQAVLRQYLSKEHIPLNVANRTYPLDLSTHSGKLANQQCLDGIILVNIEAASHSYHDLTPNDLAGKGITLVDAKKQSKIVRDRDPGNTIRRGTPVEKAVRDAFDTGLFSISEIAFDKEHRYAVVSYSFWCGSLCGNGSTLVFEKIASEWKPTSRSCGGWVS